MDMITLEEFNVLCNQPNNKLLKRASGAKPKVIETDTDDIIKIFYSRKKNPFSSNKCPALKFKKHAEKLASYQIGAPKIDALRYCPDLDTHFVCYSKIKGDDIRYLIRSGQNHMIASFATFLANLHNNGIYFRSLHLANIVYQENAQFALIDIVDMRFKENSLSFYMRYRNLKHMFIYRNDHHFWAQYGIENFMETYFKSWDAPLFYKKTLLLLLNRLPKHLLR
jgi:hypothetical protein